VVVPPFPGVFSAVGLLLADVRVDKIWTQAFRSTEVDVAEVRSQFGRITSRALDELQQEGFAGEPEVRRAINMRYLGQNYEHEIELPDGEITSDSLAAAFGRFDEMHQTRYGYVIEGETIELVSFKVTAIGRRAQVPLIDSAVPTADERSERQVFFRGAGFVTTAVVHRSGLPVGERLHGPALVQEEGSTTLVSPDMTVEKTEHGSLIITLEDQS
jgi:N-methylhydantoinase A